MEEIIISDLYQNQNITYDEHSHISINIYGENLNKNLYEKKLKEESFSLSDNTLSSIIDYINKYINEMITALKKFQEFAGKTRVASIKEKSEINNKTAEEINDKENKAADEGKNKIQNSDINVLDVIYAEFVKLDIDIYFSFENIRNKINKIKYSKDQLSIIKENSTISNFISDFEKAFSLQEEYEKFNELKFQPKYNYFKVYDNVLEIRIEVPGKVKINADYKVVDKETIITFEGKKMKDRFPKKISDNLFNIRTFGEFEINIPLEVQDYRIKFTNEGYPKFDNGIYIIQYTLAEKGETISASIEGV